MLSFMLPRYEHIVTQFSVGVNSGYLVFPLFKLKTLAGLEPATTETTCTVTALHLVELQGFQMPLGEVGVDFVASGRHSVPCQD